MKWAGHIARVEELRKAQ